MRNSKSYFKTPAWFQGEIRCFSKYSERQKETILEKCPEPRIYLNYNKNIYEKNLYSEIKSNPDLQ